MDYQTYITQSEYEQIINTISVNRGYDFSTAAATSLKFRFERACFNYGFQSFKELITKISRDDVFMDSFINDISIRSTEFFRDPLMWNELSNKILPKYKSKTDLKIWMPEVCGDEELFTLLIVLDRAGIIQKTEIYATSAFQKNINEIKSGLLENRKMEINLANTARYDDNINLSHYTTQQGKFIYFSALLIEKVIFLQHNILTQAPPDNDFDFIIYRNRLLSFNQPTKNLLIELLKKSLSNDGYLIIGTGESIENKNNLKEVSKTENIFKRV